MSDDLGGLPAIRQRLEHRTAVERAIRTLLELVGDNASRPGLERTPERFVDALREMTAGYHEDPAEHLKVVFDEDQHDEVVAVRDIEFTSVCEHHLLPFTGRAGVAYIPQGKRLVGLSKLARVVDVFSRRLQMQERLTDQIAEALVKHLDPAGVAVILEASHACMGCRGVRKPDARMVTSSMLGAFRNDPAARSEVMRLLGY